ncbi:hypothetical protein M427DRAFT_147794 [Gonapodya prolifera JEL478]|uniref:Ribonuclease H2 subunit B wHTH domain-containing protein n=1 Tax=Gonapodya prolifera (strain JEL478) TaxID=1344416 RepID=A0A139A3M9_GONPJ|nr:hypothetical protein M427DRAFT_147794 [Gonapodya prolifera JEL478]|eukprot:KXS11402.1 hypothetical protein M427DRAFT_147794 [Gonapodya prolifera JEL478]
MATQYVALLPESSIHGDKVSELVTGKHPRTDEDAVFMFDGLGGISEAQLIADDHRSYMLEDPEVVQKAGELCVMTPVDPLFLLLPVLEKKRCKTSDSAGRFLSLDDLLYSEENPLSSRISDLDGISSKIKSICDVQDHSGLSLYRLSDDKTLAWLRAKVSLLLLAFPNLQFFASFPEFYLSTGDLERLSESRTKLLIGIVSDYLPDHWSETLTASYPFLSSNAGAASTNYVPSAEAPLVYMDEIQPSRPVSGGTRKRGPDGEPGAAKNAEKKVGHACDLILHYRISIRFFEGRRSRRPRKGSTGRA